MINAAIVGLGRWGQILVNSVQDANGPKGDAIRFIRGVTRTPAKAADYCASLGIPVDDDYAAALADPAVDAVVLATPHSQHADQIVAAAEAGKHVFVEKPFTLNKADAERAVTACRKAGVVCALGHNRRFLPGMHEIRRMIETGELGQMMHVEANFSSGGARRYQAGQWRADGAGESPVGGMTGMGVHMIDSMIMMLGEIAAVRAISRRQVVDIPMDDSSVIMLEFKDGQIGCLSTIAATEHIWRIQFMGSKGWAQLTRHTELETSVEGAGLVKTAYDKVDIEQAEVEAFARAAAGGPAYPLPVEQAVHNAAVLEAITASAAKDGERIAVA
jgi:predicted dehydrogenase